MSRRLAPAPTAIPCAALCLFLGCGQDNGPTTIDEDPCRTAVVAFPEPAQTGDTRFVHDPEIVREGGTYYVFSTNDGVPIRSSTDLRNWTFRGRVFPNQLPSWAAAAVPGVQAPWAPGIGFFSGRFHLYYSLSTFGSPRSVIGLTTNPTLDPGSPDYRWLDQGKVVESFAGTGFNAIDAAVVEDAADGLWLAWGSWSGGIKLHALDRETGFFSELDRTTYSLARRPVEAAVEGPYLIRRGAYYYLFISFDLCCRGAESTYNVRVGRSESVTGPYVDRDGIALLDGGGSLVLGGYGRMRGPGHASVLEQGGHYLLVHHFYDAQDDGAAHLQVRPLLWDAGGWPLAGEAFDGTPPGPAPANTQLAGRWGYWSGDDQARAVELLPGGIARACDREGSWSFSAPVLALEWRTAAGGLTRVDSAIVSAAGNWFVGRTSAGTIVRGYRLP